MDHKARWEKLLDRGRLNGTEVQEPKRKGNRSGFVRDYDRILFSDAFRRLNDKTQVFPLSEDDHVHTRLTHSLEVSSVGRSLGIEAGDFLSENGLLPAGLTSRDIGDVVSSASLAHDIGNPPFGHSGEDAISEWFKGRSAQDLQISDDEFLELTKFEGNALGYRTLVRHQRPGGLRLCSATLAAFTKYPCVAFAEKPWARGVQHKKYGLLRDDIGSFEVVAQRCGMERIEDKVWLRHPLAFLVEAADDICYSIIDLEDGFRLGLVTLEEVKELLSPLANRLKGFKEREGEYSRESMESGDAGRGQIAALRAYAVGALINACTATFREHHDPILSGDFESSLLEATDLAPDVEKILGTVKPKCYRAKEVLEIERAGFEVLGGLLEVFYAALSPSRPKSGEKTLQAFPPLRRIADSKNSQYWKLIQLVEYVGGMTDRFAVRTFRRLRGIELPGRNL
ncbi:MAG: dGTP triphosphohydrolase [Acidobacteriota bacterium]